MEEIVLENGANGTFKVFRECSPRGESDAGICVVIANL